MKSTHTSFHFVRTSLTGSKGGIGDSDRFTTSCKGCYYVLVGGGIWLVSDRTGWWGPINIIHTVTRTLSGISCYIANLDITRCVIVGKGTTSSSRKNSTVSIIAAGERSYDISARRNCRNIASNSTSRQGGINIFYGYLYGSGIPSRICKIDCLTTISCIGFGVGIYSIR
jgi:hypothetical protein